MVRYTSPLRRGFTMMEVIVTMVLLGILAGGAALSLSGVLRGGTTASCATEKEVLRTAEEAYYSRFSSYGTMDDLVTNGLIQEPAKRHTISLTGTPPNATMYSLTGTGECEGK